MKDLFLIQYKAGDRVIKMMRTTSHGALAPSEFKKPYMMDYVGIVNLTRYFRTSDGSKVLEDISKDHFMYFKN